MVLPVIMAILYAYFYIDKIWITKREQPVITIKTLRSDNGTKYLDKAVRLYE